MQRKLAAILAADVAGYSRLMADDEEATLSLLGACRGVVCERITEHNGRVFGGAGDSVIAEFASPVQAVRAAVAIQRDLDRRNAEIPVDRRMEFRIGINLGDVMAEGENLFGDGVNVAARLQEQAAPAGIVISSGVRDHVDDKLGCPISELGERVLKNIPRPVRIHRVDWQRDGDGDGETRPAGAALAVPDKPSIAVLAFQNMSGDPEQEYFSDGITEDIITNLSKHRGLFVIARNSSFVYKGQTVDVKRVGHELGVRYILEGGVRKSGNRVRITAQLIDVVNGSHVWAEKFDRDMADLFAVQDEITHYIVGAVAPELLAAEMERARRKDPQILDAWDYAIRAQWHLARISREDNAEALRLATKSSELNPNTTAGLNIAAFAHIYDAIYNWSPSPGQSFAAAYETASRAVAIDARDEVAQTALGASEIFVARLDDATARLRHAVELNPSFNWAHGNLGLALAFSGQGDDAIGPFNEAIRLSPRDQFNFLWYYLRSFAGFIAARYEDALDSADRSLRENIRVPGAHRLRAACLSQLGRISEAKAALAEFIRLVPNASIGSMKAQLPLKRREDFDRYADALRRLGMPE